MPLTDTFVKNAKPTGKTNGDKFADGGGMYLLVKPKGNPDEGPDGGPSFTPTTTAKQWRMDLPL